MADIDQILAGGAGASTRADFSGIGKLPEAYWKGRDEFAKNDLRDAFKDGVPTTADGTPDFAAMAKTLFQKGDMGQGVAAANLGLAQQNQKFGQGQSADISNVERGAAPQQPIVGPSTSRNSVTIDPSKRADITTAPQAPQGQQPTVMTVLAAQNIPNDQLGAASASVARQLGVDPTAPLDLNDPQVRNVLAPAIAQLKRMNLGQVQPPQPGDNPPQQQPPQPGPQVAQAPPQAAPQGQPSPVTNAVTSPAAPPTLSRAEQLIAYYSGVMSDPRSPKQNVELAKTRLEALQKSNELTPDQKNYAQAVNQGFKGTMQDFLTEQESGKAGATERAKSDNKEQQEYIDQGKQASSRLTTLNTLSGIISSDPNITLGFGGPTALKVKMALESLGVPVPDLSGAQAIQKLNASLASEMAKSLTSRTTQFEFKTFLGNNPGLELDKSGNERLIGIFSQLAKRDVDLGRLARQNRDNWQTWDSVVESYDKQHPMRDPVTGKVLSTDSIIAPGPAKINAAAPSLEAGKTIVNGHVYKGGDPNKKVNWELRS